MIIKTRPDQKEKVVLCLKPFPIGLQKRPLNAQAQSVNALEQVIGIAVGVQTNWIQVKEVTKVRAVGKLAVSTKMYQLS